MALKNRQTTNLLIHNSYRVVPVALIMWIF